MINTSPLMNIINRFPDNTDYLVKLELVFNENEGRKEKHLFLRTTDSDEHVFVENRCNASIYTKDDPAVENKIGAGLSSIYVEQSAPIIENMSNVFIVPIHIDEKTEERFFSVIPELQHLLKSTKTTTKSKLSLKPDFFDGVTMHGANTIVAKLRDYDSWSITNKVKASGQHTVRQKDNGLYYEFGFVGIFEPGALSALNQQLVEDGWKTVSAVVAGSGSGTWTKLTLVREIAVEIC